MKPSIRHFDGTTEYYFQEGCYITELSNSEDDPGLSIARARIEPEVTTKLHKLIDTVERYVILQGEGLVALNGQPLEKVAACDVVLIPPDCSQKITNSGNRDLIFLAICAPRFKTNMYQEITC